MLSQSFKLLLCLSTTSNRVSRYCTVQYKAVFSCGHNVNYSTVFQAQVHVFIIWRILVKAFVNGWLKPGAGMRTRSGGFKLIHWDNGPAHGHWHLKLATTTAVLSTRSPHTQ